MGTGHDTGMDLLLEAASALDLAAEACEDPEDAAGFAALADRVRGYLAVSRPTTTLGMPRIPSTRKPPLGPDAVNRSGADRQTHIRIVPG
jgi:hypothetical protein